MKKLWKLLLLIVILVVGGAFLIKPTIKNISYGIDLQGGFEILYNIEPLDKNDTLTDADLENTYKTIVNRIDTLGVSEPVITLEGGNLIRIQLPGVSDEEVNGGVGGVFRNPGKTNNATMTTAISTTLTAAIRMIHR